MDNKRGKERKANLVIYLITLLLLIFHLKFISPVVVDQLVIEKFENQTEVYVAIMLEDNSNLSYDRAIDFSGKRLIYEEKARRFQKSEESVISVLDKNEFRLDHKFSIINAFSGYVTRQGLEKLENIPNVLVIEADRVVTPGLIESVPLINADDVWDTGYSGNGVAVCVIDTGINYSHSDLGGCFGGGCKVVGGYDYCASANCATEDSNPMDDNGHGTHVAGTVASEDLTYTGVAPNASLVAMKACVDGSLCSTTAIQKSVDWCVANSTVYNIKVITISIYDHIEYNSSNCNPTGKTAATAAINAANDSGIFVDAISGNNGYTAGISWPGCVRGATSVGSVYDNSLGREPDSGQWADALCFDNNVQSGDISCFSNRGSNLDLLAPGGIIITLRERNKIDSRQVRLNYQADPSYHILRGNVSEVKSRTMSVYD